MTDQSKRARGRWGEDRAASHYRARGFEIVDRNWRSPEREVPGELDLIVRAGRLLVFCEVKARRRAGYGGAAAAVDAPKQARIRELAASWLRVHGEDGVDDDGDAGDAGDPNDLDVRFDVVTIEGVTLDHIEAAF